MIMGSDNLATLQKWKNHDIILRDYDIYVYKRPDYEEGPLLENPHVHLFDAPLMYLSASYIREMIRQGKSVQYLVPEAVYEYLLTSHLYREY